MSKLQTKENYTVKIKARGRYYEVNNDSFVGLSEHGKVYLLDVRDDRAKPDDAGIHLAKDKFNKWVKEGSLISLGRSVEYKNPETNKTYRLMVYRFNTRVLIWSRVR